MRTVKEKETSDPPNSRAVSFSKRLTVGISSSFHPRDQFRSSCNHPVLNLIKKLFQDFLSFVFLPVIVLMKIIGGNVMDNPSFKNWNRIVPLK